jgi:hypothetical protein
VKESVKALVLSEGLRMVWPIWECYYPWLLVRLYSPPGILGIAAEFAVGSYPAMGVPLGVLYCFLLLLGRLGRGIGMLATVRLGIGFHPLSDQ